MKIGQFFRSMLSDGSDVSSKRVVGFGTWLLFAAMVIDYLITYKVIQSELIYAAVGLVTACFGLNAWVDTKAFGKNKVKDNAELEKKSEVVIEKNPPIKENVEVKPKVEEVKVEVPRVIVDDLNGDNDGIVSVKGKVHILTQDELIVKFGKPCDTNNHTRIKPAFPLMYGQAEVTSIIVHKDTAAAFTNVFKDILAHYGLEKIKELGINKYGGTYNCRPMRGGKNWSTHAWAIAIDLDPERNRLKESHKTARFARLEYQPMIDIFYKHGFISLGRERDFDWMHFQYNK